jgi:hypothetical protein
MEARHQRCGGLVPDANPNRSNRKDYRFEFRKHQTSVRTSVDGVEKEFRGDSGSAHKKWDACRQAPRTIAQREDSITIADQKGEEIGI